MRTLHDLYPTKTAANIAARTGVCTRSAERFLARERDMNAGAFIALLMTDDGGKILEAAMETLPAAKRPRWWCRHVHAAQMARVQARQAQVDEELRQLQQQRLW